MFFSRKPAELPAAETALPGRDTAMATAERHFVSGATLHGPFADGLECVLFGMGCFWGAEKLFWSLDGVSVTAAGYAGGHTPNPNYGEVCSGRTGHNEVVLVVYDPRKIPLTVLLKTFWEGHDPSQGMRQGNDVGTQYRSGIYVETADQYAQASASKEAYAIAMKAASYSAVTTEIIEGVEFYYAEADHQQYLAKVPHGYCGLGGTGVACPAGATAEKV